MKNKKLTTYQMAVTALMAAALCVLGPLSVPIGAIPISLSNFVICLTAWLPVSYTHLTLPTNSRV